VQRQLHVPGMRYGCPGGGLGGPQLLVVKRAILRLVSPARAATPWLFGLFKGVRDTSGAWVPDGPMLDGDDTVASLPPRTCLFLKPLEPGACMVVVV